MRKSRVIFGVVLMMVLFVPAGTVCARTHTPARINIKKTFPDKKVRKVVREYDKNKDGYLSKAENKKLVDLSVNESSCCEGYERKKKVSFEGCQYLTSVRQINTNYIVDVKDLKKEPFKSARCMDIDEFNSLSLDFSSCRNLENLLIGKDDYKKLNLSNSKKLQTVDIGVGKKDFTMVLNKDAKISFLYVNGTYDDGTGVTKKKPSVKITGRAQVHIQEIYGLRKLSLDVKKVTFAKTCLWTGHGDDIIINPCKNVYIRNAEEIVWEGGERAISHLVLENTKMDSLDVSSLSNLTYLNLEHGNQVKTLNLSEHNHIQELFTDEFGDVNGSLSKNPISTITVGPMIRQEDIDFIKQETEKYSGRYGSVVIFGCPENWGEIGQIYRIAQDGIYVTICPDNPVDVRVCPADEFSVWHGDMQLDRSVLKPGMWITFDYSSINGAYPPTYEHCSKILILD